MWLAVLSDLGHLRQEYKYEGDGSHQEEGGEEPEVA